MGKSGDTVQMTANEFKRFASPSLKERYEIVAGPEPRTSEAFARIEDIEVAGFRYADNAFPVEVVDPYPTKLLVRHDLPRVKHAWIVDECWKMRPDEPYDRRKNGCVTAAAFVEFADGTIKYFDSDNEIIRFVTLPAEAWTTSEETTLF
ncbi:hypothetical protein [Lacticaseibacillus zhaodongensis]|uniref:hypothetical protein n=1 Tax=Lacticaseibacillus zhaodongensis TaxID=2668065 RepID=UPI0012D302CF|nr:hypothetical protein [Lacticaseibacillus zhaodongensis]